MHPREPMRTFIGIVAGLVITCGGCAAHHATGVAEMQKAEVQRSEGDPAWDAYTSAEALLEDGRTDDAAAAYRRAQALFGDRNLTGRSMAMYGEARAYDLAGRCFEAVMGYEKYAAFVRPREPRSARAAIDVARDCHEVPLGDPALTRTADALAASDYTRALALAERVEPATPTARAWVAYDRGEALTALRRTDEAVAAFRRAQDAFDEAGDARGRAVAAWGIARVLEEANRCDDARRAYVAYERLVRPTDARSADMAASHARECGTTVLAR